MKNSNISFGEFSDSFGDSYKDNFSYQGKRALYDYITDLEEETGEEIELDTVALCVEYTEYESLAELQQNYTDIKSMDELKDTTAVIEIEGTERFIILDY